MKGFALVLFLCCVSAAVATPLLVELTSDESQSTTVRVTVRNPSATDTLVVVPYDSPLMADSPASFEVVDLETDEILEYTGAVFKRVWPPSSNSLIAIGAGEAHSASVDLTQAFSFLEGRSYSVRTHLTASVLGMYVPEEHKQKRDASSLAELFGSAASRIALAAPLRAEPALVRPSATTTPSELHRAARDLSDTGSVCTSSQNSFINTAVSMARTLIAGAQEYVDRSCKTSDYIQWFGIVSSSRYATVTSCVTNVNGLVSSTYGVDFKVACGGTACTDSIYAYVYPSDTAAPKIIHGCPVFFEASTTIGDIDTCGGTLIHESSHFVDVCGTDDHAYGTVDCQALAISNPSDAVNNADSYEYFSESQPTLCSTATTNTASSTAQTGSSTSTQSRSTTTGDSSSSTSSGCFAASSHVRVLDRGAELVKPLSEVRVGDLVESIDRDLNRVFSEVYAVLHKDSTATVDIVQLNIEGSASPLKLTPHHLLLSSSASEWQLVDAASVKVGDQLLTVDGRNTAVRRVVSIQQLKEAIRAPLTLNDRIVVDGVAASVFAHSEALYGPLCAPLKFFHKHFPHLFASTLAQAALDAVVRLTDSFEARHAVVLASF